MFFLVTNILIVGGITLLQERQSQLRRVVVVDKLRALLARAYWDNESVC